MSKEVKEALVFVGYTFLGGHLVTALIVISYKFWSMVLS